MHNPFIFELWKYIKRTISKWLICISEPITSTLQYIFNYIQLSSHLLAACGLKSRVVPDTEFEAGYRIIRFWKNRIRISGSSRIPDIRPDNRIFWMAIWQLKFVFLKKKIRYILHKPLTRTKQTCFWHKTP